MFLGVVTYGNGNCNIKIHTATNYFTLFCVNSPDQAINMKVFVLLSIIAIAFADRTCPENQHYESCGTACPLTCKNYENPPKICVLMCVSGCFCDEGYVKTEDGRCVKPEECPAQANRVCAENQEYKQCGKACPLTCDNYDNPPKICPAMCVSGCHCLEGFVKAADGRCVKPEECPSKSRNIEKNCLDKPDTGMCRGYFPMFYYDVQTGTCKEFIYGGCQGNGNRYATEEECLEHCRDVKGKQSSSDICELNPETGLCRGYFPRYYFDKLTGQCKRFIYGGCGGNKNNFVTEAECESRCGSSSLADASACDQEKVVGPCMAYFRRYFFNKQTQKCELFIYGGCRGNGNNFSTKEECESTCL
ncbi:Papilin, partial [Stegodyphus mimosarum]